MENGDNKNSSIDIDGMDFVKSDNENIAKTIIYVGSILEKIVEEMRTINKNLVMLDIDLSKTYRFNNM